MFPKTEQAATSENRIRRDSKPPSRALTYYSFARRTTGAQGNVGIVCTRQSPTLQRGEHLGALLVLSRPGLQCLHRRFPDNLEAMPTHPQSFNCRLFPHRIRTPGGQYAHV